jgi:hypothetical protein
MTEMFDQSSIAVTLGEADDLKRIRGINHGVEERLHRAGILTYAQLAATSLDDLSLVLKNMVGFSAKRLDSLDWIGQARQLALAKEQESQRYAGFTLELLLDRDNDVRRTKIKHVQTQKKESWAGWDGERMLAFISANSPIRQKSHPEGILSVQENLPDAVQGEFSREEKKPEQLLSGYDLGGDVHLSEVRLNVEGLQEASRLIPSDEALSVSLVLDLKEASKLQGVILPYSAMVFARKFGDAAIQEIGRAEGAIKLQDQVTIGVACMALSEGIYYIDATVMFSSEVKLPDRSPILAEFGESELIKVV